MSTADLLQQSELEDADKPEPVELVTLPEAIDQGVGLGNPLPFPDIASALAYAKTLPAEERNVSFIRTSKGALTLAQAEGRQSPRSAKVSPTDKPADPSETQ
jgi:hypothetical protein